ncbi:MAG: hypothetical protein KC668_09900 [Myxococcales bacterium]|nr:hypothetical protein [Myxococcales bacterium]
MDARLACRISKAGASSIGFRESVRYGLGVVGVTARAWAHRRGLLDDERFSLG